MDNDVTSKIQNIHFYIFNLINYKLNMILLIKYFSLLPKYYLMLS